MCSLGDSGESVGLRGRGVCRVAEGEGRPGASFFSPVSEVARRGLGNSGQAHLRQRRWGRKGPWQE